jgi:hypothetical protein
MKSLTTILTMLTLLTILAITATPSAQINVTLKDSTGASYANTLSVLSFTTDNNLMVIELKQPLSLPPTQKVSLTINGQPQQISELSIALSLSIPPTPVSPAPTPSTDPCANTPIKQPTGAFPAIPIGPDPTTENQLIPFLQGVTQFAGVCDWLTWATQSQENLDWVWSQTPYFRGSGPAGAATKKP